MQYAPVWHLYLARRNDEVLDQSRKVLEIFPDFEFAHSLMMNSYIQTGLLVESLRVLEKTDREEGAWCGR